MFISLLFYFSFVCVRKFYLLYGVCHVIISVCLMPQTEWQSTICELVAPTVLANFDQIFIVSRNSFHVDFAAFAFRTIYQTMANHKHNCICHHWLLQQFNIPRRIWHQYLSPNHSSCQQLSRVSWICVKINQRKMPKFRINFHSESNFSIFNSFCRLCSWKSSHRSHP